ncbi:helix-turn-helix transcriptional regulator [Rhodococcus sp. MS16]|uniref:helix-turn-helix domain-containing protein n=1 Tax=Rhodococcus sp. MS16 TaxID=2579941 RepID=UPI00156257A7|nr:helix-turn-helix transcriptional regulator [Rhodococcus sp. MS16]NRI67661.1 helix-turn-helix transcriptional regulator [Rhodococcus sp. MS16]
MAKSLDDMLAARPVNRAAVEAHKDRMIEEVRAYRLKELRESAAMTQGQVADRLGVGQNRVSNIERGDLAHIQIDTLRRYVEAVGGSLRVEVELGDDRFQIA